MWYYNTMKRYECHCHIGLNILNVSRPEEELRSRLLEYRSAGVRFCRDGGDSLLLSLRAKELAGEYGIRFCSPGAALYFDGGYGKKLGLPFCTSDGFKAQVVMLKRRGADFIKLIATGIMDFSRYGAITSKPISAGLIHELVDICHSLDMPVMAHSNGADTIRALVAAGADSIEHGYYMDRDMIEPLARGKTVWTPTLAPVFCLIGKGKYDDSVLRKILAEQSALIKAAYEAGVPIASGSDSGAAFVTPEEGILTECRLLKEAGADPARGNAMIERVFAGKR